MFAEGGTVLTERQRQIFEFVSSYVDAHGYPPTVREIGEAVGLASPSTVHAHLANLERAGLLKRDPTKPRALELIERGRPQQAPVDDVHRLPLVGEIAAGGPLLAEENIEEHLAVPETLARGDGEEFLLRVKGDSMIDEQIRDGDFVIVEDRKSVNNGEMVIALLGGLDVTLKKFFRENGMVRLQPANPSMQPIMVESDQVQVQGVVVGVMRRY
jgi:repressor LexA